MVSPQQPTSLNAGDGTTTPREIIPSDPSGTIFSMYVTRVQKFEDEKNVENWKGGAEGILVFTGLFSATVATFIALSYPNLQQDPNVTTHSLLAQISQQLSNTNSNVTIHATSPSIESPYSPPTSVVFINAVWFLSLVLSLTCALMATLLQQWARRYLQIVQGKYAPLHHARIHEYFSRGARRFGIFGFVEVLPLLLLLSVFLFFAGLVVFAFRGNHIVAYFTLAIVGFCTLSYIALTLMPLISHDCPYQTPLTSVLWFIAQRIISLFLSALSRGAKRLQKPWRTISESMVESLRRRHKNKARKSLSDSVISKLESSTEPISVAMNKKILARTLHWLYEDHELEEFVAGIPGLYESEVFTYSGDVRLDIRPVLATLPGPANSHNPLSWNIIWLAQRAITRNLSKPIQQRRTLTSLRALYHIPGAIRDILASYAAGNHFCLEMLPLLNSPESLEIIHELWDTLNDDVALSVRCVAAVVTAFMITPPRRVLDNFLAPDVGFIGNDKIGKQFLSKRLRVGSSANDFVAPEYDPRDDSARLQNIVRFLADIRDTLKFMDTRWWTSDDPGLIRRERQALFEYRHQEGYRIGRGTFVHHGNRASSAFVPAAQQDLIALTLEIMARDPVGDAGTSQREAFLDTCRQLGQEAADQAQEKAREQTLAQAFTQAQAVDSIDMVKRALEPVLRGLQLEVVDNPMPHADDPVGKVMTNYMPDPAYVTSAHSPQPPPIVAPSFLLQSLMPPSTGLTTTVAELSHSPV